MIERTFYVIILCALSASAMIAQPSALQPKLDELNKSESNVVLIRKTGIVGSAIAIKTFVDDSSVTKLRNNRFASQVLNKESHTISYQYYGKKKKKKAKSIQVTSSGGEDKYILFFLEQKFFNNKLHAVELTEESARHYLSSLKESK